MNMDAITGPMGSLRVQVLRLSALVATQSRHAGEVALRGSASALTRTAQRLDTLADRLADAPAVAADAHAEVVVADDVKVEDAIAVDVKADEVAVDVKADDVKVEAVVEAAASEPLAEASSPVAKPEHGASTPEASPYASKKKHRQERRRR